MCATSVRKQPQNASTRGRLITFTHIVLTMKIWNSNLTHNLNSWFDIKKAQNFSFVDESWWRLMRWHPRETELIQDSNESFIHDPTRRSSKNWVNNFPFLWALARAACQIEAQWMNENDEKWLIRSCYWVWDWELPRLFSFYCCSSSLSPIRVPRLNLI